MSFLEGKIEITAFPTLFLSRDQLDIQTGSTTFTHFDQPGMIRLTLF